MCVYIYMFVCVICMYVRVRVRECMFACTSVCSRVPMYICMRACVCVSDCVCSYLYECLDIHICTYVGVDLGTFHTKNTLRCVLFVYAGHSFLDVLRSWGGNDGGGAKEGEGASRKTPSFEVESVSVSRDM